MLSRNPDVFSPWCAMCLANDGKEHVIHVAEERRRRSQASARRGPRLRFAPEEAVTMRAFRKAQEEEPPS